MVRNIWNKRRLRSSQRRLLRAIACLTILNFLVMGALIRRLQLSKAFLLRTVYVIVQLVNYSKLILVRKIFIYHRTGTFIIKHEHELLLLASPHFNK